MRDKIVIHHVQGDGYGRGYKIIFENAFVSRVNRRIVHSQA